MTFESESDPESASDADRSADDGYDPFEHVPDRIDIVTASGLEQLDDALNEANRATLRSEPVEIQAVVLWRLVEQGTIDLDIGGR